MITVILKVKTIAYSFTILKALASFFGCIITREYCDLVFIAVVLTRDFLTRRRDVYNTIFSTVTFYIIYVCKKCVTAIIIYYDFYWVNLFRQTINKNMLSKPHQKIYTSSISKQEYDSKLMISFLIIYLSPQY